MKRFYRLLNAQLGELLIGMLLLCAGLITASWLLIHIQIKDYNFYSVHERFEDIYHASGMPIVFLLCLIGVFALFIKSFYAAYWGSKSIYTLLTLPMKREIFYLSKLCSLIISVLMLLCAQLVGFIIAYRYMEVKVASYSSGQFDMANGLFLAFIRSDFMRLLYPYGSVNVLSTVSIFVVLITGVFYVVICERSQRRWGPAMIPIVSWLIMTAIQTRLGAIYSNDPVKMVLIYSLAMLVISVACVWHSVVLLKKGAIA